MHDVLLDPMHKETIARGLSSTNFPIHSLKTILHTPFEETRKKWSEFGIISNKKLRSSTSSYFDCEPSSSQCQSSIPYVKPIESPPGSDILESEEILIHLNKHIETVFLAEHIKEEEEVTLPIIRTDDTHNVIGTLCSVCRFRQVNTIIKKSCGHLYCMDCLNTLRSLKRAELEFERKTEKEIKCELERMTCPFCKTIIGELHFVFHPNINHSRYHDIGAEICRKCGVRRIDTIFYPCAHLFCNTCYYQEYHDLRVGLTFDFKSERVIDKRVHEIGIRCFECHKKIEAIQKAYLI